MAKKVVATLKKEGSESITKCIKMVKTDKGTYQFKELITDKSLAKDFFNKK